MNTRQSILSGLQNMKPHDIVMTGGPCGGKTSTLAYLRDELANRGFHVLVCPEVATTVISGGIDPRIMSKVTFQELLLKTSLHQEETFRSAANYFAKKREELLCCMIVGSWMVKLTWTRVGSLDLSNPMV
jgi:predicted ATPase